MYTQIKLFTPSCLLGESSTRRHDAVVAHRFSQSWQNIHQALLGPPEHVSMRLVSKLFLQKCPLSRSKQTPRRTFQRPSDVAAEQIAVLWDINSPRSVCFQYTLPWRRGDRQTRRTIFGFILLELKYDHAKERNPL